MVKLHAMTCGWLTMSLGALLRGEEGRLKIPVPCYLIEHPKGRALFDSGLHLSMQTDAAARLGPLAPMFEIDFEPGQELAARLATCGTGVDEIDWLVNSHLHFDHCGGNEAVPDSPVVVQRRELEAARDPDLAAASGFSAQDWDHGHDFVVAEGEHDLFGDGSVLCLPTYGHTPGHQSLRVRLAGGDVVLTGDACYLRRTLEGMHLPGIAHDDEAMLASLRRLADLEQRGARIFYGHDPEFWRSVPQAPLEVT